MSVLALQLEDYKPLVLPNIGNPASLTETEVAANEAFLRNCLKERERTIRTLLAQHGVFWPENLQGIEHEPLVQATRQWVIEHGPALLRPIKAKDIRKHWLYGDRAGDFAGLSLVSDIAILLGQYVVANRSSLHWGMDRDPVNKADGMSSVNRWVLLGDWIPDPRVKVVVDIEETVLSLFINTEKYYPDTWKIVIDGSLSGGYEGSALT